MKPPPPLRPLADECNWPRLWSLALVLAVLALIIITINTSNQ